MKGAAQPVPPCARGRALFRPPIQAAPLCGDDHAYDDVMFDWIESVAVWFVTIAVAFAAGLFTAFLEPVQRFAARLDRTVIRASPVRVHVETRLDVIWAGDPMAWIAHEFYLPGGVEGLPAGTLADWQEWIAKRGGCDHRMTLVMRALTPGLGHVESSSCWRKRDDQDYGQEELLR